MWYTLAKFEHPYGIKLSVATCDELRILLDFRNLQNLPSLEQLADIRHSHLGQSGWPFFPRNEFAMA